MAAPANSVQAASSATHVIAARCTPSSATRQYSPDSTPAPVPPPAAARSML